MVSSHKLGTIFLSMKEQHKIKKDEIQCTNTAQKYKNS